ncbi:MAG: RNHCP domain-containing protein [Micrococcus sp.]|nr:RNHCP domain-containing protein [Micrococcus sp.]
MSRSSENTAFDCAACGRGVVALTNGSYRNHCPFCLSSLHVDETPGDRASTCHGIMDAVAVDYSGKKGFQLVHECRRCGHRQRNKVAENCRQPDDRDRILALQTQNTPWPHA